MNSVTTATIACLILCLSGAALSAPTSTEKPVEDPEIEEFKAEFKNELDEFFNLTTKLVIGARGKIDKRTKSFSEFKEKVITSLEQSTLKNANYSHLPVKERVNEMFAGISEFANKFRESFWPHGLQDEHFDNITKNIEITAKRIVPEFKGSVVPKEWTEFKEKFNQQFGELLGAASNITVLNGKNDTNILRERMESGLDKIVAGKDSALPVNERIKTTLTDAKEFFDNLGFSLDYTDSKNKEATDEDKENDKKNANKVSEIIKNLLNNFKQ